jgi:tetratricopeptide (TPR) repeat protein
MDPTKKRELLTLYQGQVRDFPEKAQIHFALGLSYLDLRLYDQALASLKQALGKGLREASLYFYIALASLGGKQPRVLTLAKIKEIENYLDAAIRSDSDSPEAHLLWAIIKHDYYRANGLRVPSPGIQELLASARGCRSYQGTRLIAKHTTIPALLRETLAAERSQ